MFKIQTMIIEYNKNIITPTDSIQSKISTERQKFIERTDKRRALAILIYVARDTVKYIKRKEEMTTNNAK